MVNKQIIDDVDVSECKYFCLNQMGNNCLNHNRGFSMNCNNNNCYYKQFKRKENELEARDTAIKEFNRAEELKTLLKRKEQECEQEKALKETYLTCYKAKHEDIKCELFKLRAEKEEIKKYLGISSKTIMERLEELQEFRDNDKDKLYQAKQTLTEIKEIAEEYQKEYSVNNGVVLLCNQILQKISEVENG